MGDLRLATACAGLNTKALVAAIVEANWNTLRVKKNMMKKCRNRLSTLGELTPAQIGRIKESVQEACEAEGLGSMMVKIRMRASDAMGIDCSKGAALQTCNKTICKLLRKRAPPGHTVEAPTAADWRRARAAMATMMSYLEELVSLLEEAVPSSSGPNS